MSKSIYDEAILELEYLNTDMHDVMEDYIENYNHTLIKKALEQAQKQEKLLDLYREHFWLTNVTEIEWPTLAYDRALEIKKQIKEIENNERN